MSNRALTWAFEQPVRNAGRKFVLVALADKADEANSCWPSQATLAAMTGQSERSVRDHLRHLEEDGLVVRTMRRMAGHRSSDRYVLTVSVAVGITPAQPAPVRVSLPEDSAGSQAADLAGSDADQPAKAAGSQPADLAKPTGRSRRVTQREPSVEPSVVAERADVDRICTRLADRIEANGSKRPPIGKTWRDAARLMIDVDGRTEDKIMKAIDWCQADEFWRANILSMPKLRKQYDQLRLAAQRGVKSASATAPVGTASWMNTEPTRRAR